MQQFDDLVYEPDEVDLLNAKAFTPPFVTPEVVTGARWAAQFHEIPMDEATEVGYYCGRGSFCSAANAPLAAFDPGCLWWWEGRSFVCAQCYGEEKLTDSVSLQEALDFIIDQEVMA